MKIHLNFDRERTTKPIISTIILSTGVQINILRAKVDEAGGEVLVEIPDAEAEKVMDAFRSMGVEVHVGRRVEILREKCIDCGHCITICPVEAIYAESDLTVKLNQEKCVDCGACIDSCPARAIRVM
ncbi:MAG: 4Fe-4S binding protein [Candidatus Bathyarchaeia archaeon]|nr:4Fe-4S binding protein [Candidatus Bathyarchaeota archaeon]